MKNTLQRSAALLLLAALGGCGGDADDVPASGRQHLDGFIDLYLDSGDDRLLIAVESLDTPFLYQASMARGVGSNDLFLDRGQLGDAHVVRFLRSGAKVLLVADNLDYRAGGADVPEAAAVEQSFARSVIWGFEVVEDRGDHVLIDGTEFFLRDAHGLAQRLAAAGEGSYQADASRSAVYMPRTRAFPDNTEVEALVTLTGEPTGPHLPTVVPDARAITVHLHHSFVRLPDDGYEPLPYDPRAGVIGLSNNGRGFVDYASAIGEPLHVNYGLRHRLEKKNPDAEVSEAVEPIVYYLDPGVPEPVRSALLDGARWWNQAFEAAGYRDAFRVEMLPDDADPMDVRYNVIQWVHRSTRGWSYGSSVVDPRTGEILKGHVSLGSLRVRQDYMIAEGLLSPYVAGAEPETMLEMSLARIRQLSAHEVGHTLGFEHNFAASTQDRASVMDYPFPKIGIGMNGVIDLSDAYDDRIGSWDTRTVMYAYEDFPESVSDRDAARSAIVDETIALGFRYVADQDSRSIGSAHPHGNLWDNGADAIVELNHLMAVRSLALTRLAENSIREGRPLATIEEVLVPIYLLHRFQIEAVGKLVGGYDFSYALRGDGQRAPEAVPAVRQRAAIEALLDTLRPAALRLPDSVVGAIPPRPPGLPRDRETFSGATGSVFDPLAPAASAATLTLRVLLEPTRAARMQRNDAPGFAELLEVLGARIAADAAAGPDAETGRQTQRLFVVALLGLVGNAAADAGVRGIALDAVTTLDERLAAPASGDTALAAHRAMLRRLIARGLDDPESVEGLLPVTVPPGSPIGSDGFGNYGAMR